MAKRMYTEEGLKGFYKGYFAYIFAIVFWAAALPATADNMMSVYPYLENLRNRKSRQELLEQ